MYLQPQENLLPDFHEHIKAVILGTGTPRAFYGRAKAGVAILAGDKTFLFDCGGATVDQLIKAGIMPQRISDVFFTHHHSDHNSGFFDVFITSWRTHVIADRVFEGRKGPMNVYGPQTTKAIIGKMRDSFDFDVNLRVNYNFSAEDGQDIHYHESNEGIVYERDGVKITAFEVDHRPVYPAIAYKIEYNGKSVVISGDTIPVDNMVTHSRGIDLLIHESYNKSWLDTLIAKFPEQKVGLSNPAKYHSTTLEVAEIARKAGIAHLVLTHHIPAPAANEEAEAAYTEGMSDIYKGPITMARDLMAFDL
ncbi:MBL fold metallo-hydrolase [Paenibacillus alba]|uniref:MBL fold metallo-hydrolase n=1 Tax=Paenibacillus alba TaxID=1197127 RepID=UPI001564A84E|nr:MBL fold metallo-hydrolase [Paenibacillus alba]NQX68112.1 MBL fold metallo-hydrolase [Paenibacillus alba]